MSSSLSFRGVDGVPTQDAVQDLAVYAVMVSTDFGALIVSVLGVLIIAGEYGTGVTGRLSPPRRSGWRP